MPRDFITADGFGITPACRRYLAPLIQGEDYPPYKNGVPDYARLEEPGGEEEAQDRFQAVISRHAVSNRAFREV